MAETVHLTADEAAAELNVSKATLYAYVSRGLVRSEQTGTGRRHAYRAEDIRALREGRERGRGHDPERTGALDFGAPVLESAITFIGDDGLYYRGRDACALARTSSVEHVASLLWNLHDEDPFSAQLEPELVNAFDASAPGLAHLRPIDRCIAMLPILSEADSGAWSTGHAGLVRTGTIILRFVAAILAGTAPAARPVADTLADGWSANDDVLRDLVRMSLILSADHELNVSAFTVRCTISAGASLYGAILSGLAALQGFRHGGAVERSRELIERACRSDDVPAFVRRRMRRGEGPPGFGHPLYPDGDPRASLLLGRIHDELADTPVASAAESLVASISEMAGLAPNIDFANALIGKLLGLPEESAINAFAVGRTVGWIGHALEQVETGKLIRPRARYTGPAPSPDRQPRFSGAAAS